METKNEKAASKCSSEMKPEKESKSLEVPTLAVPTKGFKSMNSTDEEKSCLKKCVSVIKYHRKQKDVEKAKGPGNNGSSQSETISRNRIEVKAPSKQITEIGKRAYAETEQHGEESCLGPDMCISDEYDGLKARFRQDPASDSQEKLLPEEMIQLLSEQDIQLPEKKMTEILYREAAQYEKSSKKIKKKMKISSHEAAQKENPAARPISRAGYALGCFSTKKKMDCAESVLFVVVSEGNTSLFYAQKVHDSLKARVAALRQETSMLNQELRRLPTLCMHLIEDNKILMDELKKMCEPHIIEILEAKDPNNNSQTDLRT
ncbi:hypothetical protein OROHE_027003 [Orobanche hederae]